jgi:hypothetical protein
MKVSFFRNYRSAILNDLAGIVIENGCCIILAWILHKVLLVSLKFFIFGFC